MGNICRIVRTIAANSVNGGSNYGCHGTSHCSGVGSQGNLFQFFKPNISIEYDKNDPNNYTPTLELFSPEGGPSGIVRKFVKVSNNGRAIAHGCRAELRTESNKRSVSTSNGYQAPMLGW